MSRVHVLHRVHGVHGVHEVHRVHVVPLYSDIATREMGHYRELIRPIVAVSLAALVCPSFERSPAFAEATADKPAAAVEPQSRTQPAADTSPRWPRFRGPDSNPVSDNPNLPVTWSRTENVEWVADVAGDGWAWPGEWGTRVFLTAA